MVNYFIMQTISQLLENKFRHAFDGLGLDKSTPVLLVEATRAEFGDFQVNGVMSAAKLLKTNPRDLAAKVIDKVARATSEIPNAFAHAL